MYNVAIKRDSMTRSSLVSTGAASRGKRRYLFWSFAAVFFVIAIVCVWSRAKVVGLGYEISTQSRHLYEARVINEKLRAEVAMLKAPGRIEPIAKEKLKLLPPKSDQIILMR